MPEAALTLEQQQARELARMKRVPVLLLILMAVTFAWSLGRPEPWAGWVHAFAEAGMVGALADWFAVVALFKHPLGLPIPHTAIIPRRKDELGDAMARFVADHFLEPAVVRAKLEGINLAGYAITYLKSSRGQERLLELADGILRWALGALSEQRVRRFLVRFSRSQLQRMELAPILGNIIDWMVKGGRHQDMLTQLLRYAIVQLNDHRESIRERVQEESPWWVPGFVDDRILKKMLEKVEHQLFAMSLDPQHPTRMQFNRWLTGFAVELKRNPEYRRTGERIKEQFLDNDELQDYLFALWQDLSARLLEDLDDEDSLTLRELRNALDRLAGELEADKDMQAWINRWLTDTVVVLVDGNRHQMASLISDTVRTWDGRDTSRRVELALGRDLQFIRINGTLVGGLVGMVIHAITLLAGH